MNGLYKVIPNGIVRHEISHTTASLTKRPLDEHVTHCGCICFKGQKVNLSYVFAGQNMGVIQVGERMWLFAKAGRDVVFSYARSQRKLNRLARQAGRRASAGTPREAAENADVLLLGFQWSRVNDVLKQAGDLSGKVLITCRCR